MKRQSFQGRLKPHRVCVWPLQRENMFFCGGNILLLTSALPVPSIGVKRTPRVGNPLPALLAGLAIPGPFQFESDWGTINATWLICLDVCCVCFPAKGCVEVVGQTELNELQEFKFRSIWGSGENASSPAAQLQTTWSVVRVRVGGGQVCGTRLGLSALCSGGSERVAGLKLVGLEPCILITRCGFQHAKG